MKRRISWWILSIDFLHCTITKRSECI